MDTEGNDGPVETGHISSALFIFTFVVPCNACTAFIYILVENRNESCDRYTTTKMIDLSTAILQNGARHVNVFTEAVKLQTFKIARK
jgi:hypothetical protein